MLQVDAPLADGRMFFRWYYWPSQNLFYVNDVDECTRLPRGNGNFARFLLFLPRICMINQRLHIVYVRLATNLLQIT